VSYARLIESLMRHGHPGDSRQAISWEWAADTVEHPDFDIPGEIISTKSRYSPTSVPCALLWKLLRTHSL